MGWMWPSSVRVARMGQARWTAIKIPPVSASAAEDITFLIVLHMTCSGEFLGWRGFLVGSFPRTNQAAALDLADEVGYISFER